MQNIAAFSLLLLMALAACQPDKKPARASAERVSAITPQGFHIGLDLAAVAPDQYFLEVELEMDTGNYVVSSSSTDNIYGHFEIGIADSPHLRAEAPLEEIPRSVEEFDPIIQQPVKFIRQNTLFKQLLAVSGQEDFTLNGLIEFVLEPSCVPYEVAFSLTRRDGKLTLTKTKTAISQAYKL